MASRYIAETHQGWQKQKFLRHGEIVELASNPSTGMTWSRIWQTLCDIHNPPYTGALVTANLVTIATKTERTIRLENQQGWGTPGTTTRDS